MKKNQNLMECTNKYPELDSFINTFAGIQEALDEGRKVKLTICIGRARKKGFNTYLRSKIENPKIRFSSYKTKSGEEMLQIVISDKTETIALFTLDDIRMVSADIGRDDGSLFIRHEFKICIDERFDYKISASLYK